MTTPVDPQGPRASRAAATRVRAARDTAGTAGLLATGALLGLLVPAVVMASTVRAVPAGPLVTAAVLLFAAAVVLCVEAPAGRAEDSLRPCGLEDASDTLRCGLSAGHSGLHLDVRAARAFEETLDDRIGEAGAYYRDGRGRAVPIDDAF
ncbi:hypothetical protein ACH9EU_01860 [Kocuria sp. M1R5S2]|uniref:hypothetical protein n=1 Tax=Kocuria rhizosphaerae TaxID=3376285 RepID=UPI003799F580